MSKFFSKFTTSSSSSSTKQQQQHYRRERDRDSKQPAPHATSSSSTFTSRATANAPTSPALSPPAESPRKRERTTSTIRPLATYGGIGGGGDFSPGSFTTSSVSVSGKAPRLDLDFRIPGETATATADFLRIDDSSEGEGSENTAITEKERGVLRSTRYTYEQGRLFWKHTVNDLRILAVDKPGILEYDVNSFTQSEEDAFYRLLAIFTVATSPQILSSFPSLFNYFPPPAFVADDHDWIGDYTSHSGWIREGKVLSRALRWVLKRTSGERGSGTGSQAGLPQWYKTFAEEERQSNYPNAAFETLLRSQITAPHLNYLKAVFEQVALIGANGVRNGASVEWLCGVLGWWLLKVDGRGSSGRVTGSGVDFVARVEEWEGAALAMEHLFVCWVR